MSVWHIASLLVHVPSLRVKAFIDAVGQIPGLEYAARHDDGRVILLAEAESAQLLAEQLSRVEAMPGVLSARLVYHHCEPGLQQPLENDIDADPA